MNPETPNEGESSSKQSLDNTDEKIVRLTKFVPTFEEQRSAIEINPDYLDQPDPERKREVPKKKKL